MSAKYILGALGVVFLVLGARAAARGTPAGRIQARTWLRIRAIFVVVSGWLFLSTGATL